MFVSKKEKEKIDFGAMSEDTILVCENPQVLEKGVFEKQMLEKLIWISAFMLVGARHPGATVGAVEKEYRSEVICSRSLMNVLDLFEFRALFFH